MSEEDFLIRAEYLVDFTRFSMPERQKILKQLYQDTIEDVSQWVILIWQNNPRESNYGKVLKALGPVSTLEKQRYLDAHEVTYLSKESYSVHQLESK